jgi:hypothetical protein
MIKKGVAAFAFGVPSTIWSNQEISRIAVNTAAVESLTIFTQLDIQASSPSWGKITVEYLPDEDPKDPPPTLRIARWVIRRAVQEDLSEIIVVAARPHIWRVMRDMEEAAREAGFLQLLIKPAPETWSYREEKWYCADSTQKRVQSREAWREREAVLEAVPFWLYREIAG